MSWEETQSGVNAKTSDEVEAKRLEIQEFIRNVFRGRHRDIAVPAPDANKDLGVGDYDPGEFDVQWRGFIANITVELQPTVASYMQIDEHMKKTSQRYVGKVAD